MRDITFRAFFDKYKRMIEEVYLLPEDMILVKFNDEGFYEKLYLLDDIHIMQYTGLKDKNGKEIYEGDIVEVDATTTTDWEKHRFKIVNIQGAFCITSDIWQEISSFLNNSICDDVMSLFELWWHNTEDTGDNDLTFVEVIGNIHENPELLEE